MEATPGDQRLMEALSLCAHGRQTRLPTDLGESTAMVKSSGNYNRRLVIKETPLLSLE